MLTTKDCCSRIKNMLVPIHAAGVSWIAMIAGTSLLLALFSEFLGFVGLLATLYLVFAFRNPTRMVATEVGVVVAPADGIVTAITEVIPPAAIELGGEALQRVSIQASLLDVQIQRLPASGKIVASVHIPGMFASSAPSNADTNNERQMTTLVTDEGQSLGLVQIGSPTGRFIQCDAKAGDHVKRGEPFGMVRFGGRVDVYLPRTAQVSVLIGQRMVAGETVLARFVVV